MKNPFAYAKTGDAVAKLRELMKESEHDDDTWDQDELWGSQSESYMTDAIQNDKSSKSQTRVKVKGAYDATQYAVRTIGYYGASATEYVAGTSMAAKVASTALAGSIPALAAAAPVLGPAGIAMMVGEMGLAIRSAVLSYRHIKTLEDIVVRYGHRAHQGTLEAVAFTCIKKNRKMKTKGTSAIPVAGYTACTLYSGVRSIYKRVTGTRGRERRDHAYQLWINHLCGDPCARAACEDLLGKKTFSKVKRYFDGHVLLKKKMKSL